MKLSNKGVIINSNYTTFMSRSQPNEYSQNININRFNGIFEIISSPCDLITGNKYNTAPSSNSFYDSYRMLFLFYHNYEA
jgi:hypothetical protein